MKRLSAALLFALFLQACSTTPPPVATKYPPIDPAWYEPYAAGGTATVAGQAFLRTRGGDVKVGAGSQVTLDPATPYSAAWWNSAAKLWVHRFEIPRSAEFTRARKTTIADAEGRFKFTNLAPGSYYVRSIVTWERPGGYGTTALEGGIVFTPIDVAAGETKDVVLTW
jgi:hypothetical protein